MGCGRARGETIASIYAKALRRIDTAGVTDAVKKAVPGPDARGKTPGKDVRAADIGKLTSLVSTDVGRLGLIPHHLTVEGNRLLNPGEVLRQTVNIPAAVVGQELVFVIVDCSRNVRLKLVALDRGWIPDDLQPDSEVRP